MLGALLPSIGHASLWNQLSSADQARVRAGQQVMVTEPLEGYPWPRAKIYQQVSATPAQVMAVFFDYDNACHYVPNCTKSRIAKEIDSRTYEVDYVIDVPILPDESYTVRNRLGTEADGGLSVSWQVLRATSILESKGNLVVEPQGTGSLLCYTNLVKPGSRAAVLLRGIAMSQMKDTVTALVDQVRKTEANPAAMAPVMKRLDAALN
jgi:hypothetical protein